MTRCLGARADHAPVAAWLATSPTNVCAHALATVDAFAAPRQGTRAARSRVMLGSKLMIVTLGVSLAATSCATKRGTGTAVGAGAGGALGYAVGGTSGLLIGAALGGALGYTAGRAMEEEDRRRAAIALEQNRMMEWHNAQTGYDYRVEPRGTRYLEGRECRDFRMLAEVEGRPDEVTGTACRRPDGSWEAIQG